MKMSKIGSAPENKPQLIKSNRVYKKNLPTRLTDRESNLSEEEERQGLGKNSLQTLTNRG